MNMIDHRRKAVLIVQCDTATLTRQNLALGNVFQERVKLAFPRNPVYLVRSYSEADLLEELRNLDELRKPYRTIVVIGHSNKNGLQISSDRFIDWKGVAKWFERLEPHRIILIACEAGRWLPCTALFEGIPTLKDIFGSPVPANKDQAYVVLFRVLNILGTKKEDRDLVRLMQVGNFLITKGVMFNRTRDEYESSGSAEGVLWNQAESIIDELIKSIR
jgi:hypothetical protein